MGRLRDIASRSRDPTPWDVSNDASDAISFFVSVSTVLESRREQLAPLRLDSDDRTSTARTMTQKMTVLVTPDSSPKRARRRSKSSSSRHRQRKTRHSHHIAIFGSGIGDRFLGTPRPCFAILRRSLSTTKLGQSKPVDLALTSGYYYRDTDVAEWRNEPPTTLSCIHQCDDFVIFVPGSFSVDNDDDYSSYVDY